MRLGPLVVAGTTFLLALTLAGCAASAAPQSADTPLAQIESSRELVHPPYVAGFGSVSGTLVRSTVSTYTAGSLQKPLPFPAAIVSWESGDLSGESEFLINGRADLILDDVLEPRATSERIYEVLQSTAPETALQIDYEGSDLTPGFYAEPPADFPHALVTTLTIDTRK